MTGSSRVVATDTLPFIRRMSATSYHPDVNAALPRQWRHVYNGEIKLQSSWDKSTVESESNELEAGTAALSDLTFLHGELADDAIEESDG